MILVEVSSTQVYKSWTPVRGDTQGIYTSEGSILQ